MIIIVHNDINSNKFIKTILTSAVGMGPSPTWQSNTKHYNFFQNIIKFVYETNNTFVTWNRYITFMGIN